MTLPTLTWVQGNSQATAGALSAVQVLAQIKAAIDADDGLWEVKTSDLVGAYPYVEVGLVAGPSGNDLDTARVLFFGGATPNAAALEPNGTDAASAAAIYIYLALDPSGAVGDYRSVDPYASATRKLKGKYHMNALPGGGNPYTYTIQSSEGLVVVSNGGTSNACAMSFAGRLIEQNSTPVWCVGSGYGAWTGFITSLTTAVNMTGVAGLTETTNTASIRALIGSTVYTAGRLFTDLTLLGVGLSNLALGFTLHSIFLGGRVRGSASSYEFFGLLRQIRFGATTSDRAKINSGASVVAFGVSPTVASNLTNTIYFDQQA